MDHVAPWDERPALLPDATRPKPHRRIYTQIYVLLLHVNQAGTQVALVRLSFRFIQIKEEESAAAIDGGGYSKQQEGDPKTIRDWASLGGWYGGGDGGGAAAGCANGVEGGGGEEYMRNRMTHHELPSYIPDFVPGEVVAFNVTELHFF